MSTLDLNDGLYEGAGRHYRREIVTAELHYWEDWDSERLLDLRLCDLGLNRMGWLVSWARKRLYAELAARGVRTRPPLWLSDDWFTPEGVPGIAVPFYLAHPRLAQLELDCLGELEGGTPESCLAILRHEAGHVLDHAFSLRRRPERQRIFGLSSERYPDRYPTRPHSRSFVRNLPGAYAQSHPDEDFAETFAVWLDPESTWKQKYRGWPASRKLAYVDGVMKELAGKRALRGFSGPVFPLSDLQRTLRAHYLTRQARFLGGRQPRLDRDLTRLFVPGETSTDMTAAAFLRKIKKDTSRRVAHRIGAYQYSIQGILEQMQHRAAELGLCLNRRPREVRADLDNLLLLRATAYLESGIDLVSL